MTDLVVRPAEPHELRDVANAMRVGLLSPHVSDDEWEKWRAGWETGHLAIGAWDGDVCVGHAGAFSFDTRVPGGAWLSTSGVTRVGVLPTHTRRGLLTRMMRRLLDDERADGKVLSSLRASEAVIYSRFGFGLAGEAVGVRVHPHRIDAVRGAAAGTMRILTPAQFDGVIPELYTHAATRAGAITRSSFFWLRVLKEATEGSKGTFVAVHTSPDGIDDGYVLYSVEWDDAALSENMGRCELHELFGATPEAELALWQYMVSISLLRSIDAEARPVDDLVRLAITDMRAYEVKQRWDEQWIRLLDVEAALSARSYGTAEPVTIAITDPWYPDNDGTYVIASDGVSRTSDRAELSAPIEAVSASYMGAISWSDLLSTGRVSGDADAAARADALFAHRPATWSGTFF
jgi:predicted acetyltransferase